MSEPDHAFQIFLKATAHQLWPLVTNTERLNVVSGLPPVNYREEAQEAQILRDAGWHGQTLTTSLKGFADDIPLLRFTPTAPED